MDAASLLLPLLLIAGFYVILIRPQQRQRREMAMLQQSLQPGARVMTGAGLLATVVEVNGDEVVLEVAPGVHNRYMRRAIVNVVPPEESTGIHDDDTVGDARGAADETSTGDDVDQGGRPEPASQGEDRTNGDDVR